MFNVKVLVGAYNQEKALEGPFSVIVKLQSSRRFVCSSTSERMRVTRTEEGDLSVIMETPGRGPE